MELFSVIFLGGYFVFWAFVFFFVVGLVIGIFRAVLDI